MADAFHKGEANSLWIGLLPRLRRRSVVIICFFSALPLAASSFGTAGRCSRAVVAVFVYE